MSNDIKGSVIVSTLSRPKRIAFLVHPTQINNQEINAIIRYYASLWGGRFNVIVPTTATKILPNWFQLLVDIDPDYICTLVDLNDSILKKITRFILPKDVIKISKDDLKKRGLIIDGRNFCALDISELIKWRMETRSPYCPPAFFFFSNSMKNEHEQNFVERNFGLYDMMNRAPLYGELLFEQIDLRKVTLNSLLEKLIPDSKNLVMPSDYSALAVNHRPEFENNTNYQGCHIIIGDSGWDIAYYWNLMAVSIDAIPRNYIWLPSIYLDDNKQLDSIAHWIECSNSYSLNFTVSSISINNEKLNSFAHRLGQRTGFIPKVHSLEAEKVVWPKRTKERKLCKRNTEIVPLSANKGMTKLLAPPFVVKGDQYDGWMVDIDIQCCPENLQPISNYNSFWRLPKRPWLSDNFFVGYNKNSRITYEGRISTSIKAHEKTIIFCVPSIKEIIETYVDKKCHITNVPWSKKVQKTRFTSLKISDEGSYLQNMIKLFGNIAEAGGFFEDPFWRDTFLFFVGKSKYEELIEGKGKKMNVSGYVK